MVSGDRVRLDLLLIIRKLYATRSRARDAILRSGVMVNGAIISRPGVLTYPSATIKIIDEAVSYVSRSALKLKHGLSISGFTPKNKNCLDLGTSTGGFSQVLLEQGAARVFALDVGHGQLDKLIGNNNRIVELSGLNARDLTINHLNGQHPEFLVGDLSFISLKLALPPALELAEKNAKGIFLIKPQFEVGRKNLNKKGIVRDAKIGARAAQLVCNWLDAQNGWKICELMPSPIEGGDGNQEYIVAAQKME